MAVSGGLGLEPPRDDLQDQHEKDGEVRGRSKVAIVIEDELSWDSHKDQKRTCVRAEGEALSGKTDKKKN